MNRRMDVLRPGKVLTVVALLGVVWLVTVVAATLIGPFPVSITLAWATRF